MANIDKTIEVIEKLPVDEELVLIDSLSYGGNGYETRDTGLNSDDLKELVRQRNALLAAMKQINDVGYPVPELDALIRDCEGREEVKQSRTF